MAMSMHLKTFTADEILSDPACLRLLNSRWEDVPDTPVIERRSPARRQVQATVIFVLLLAGAGAGYLVTGVPFA